MNTEKNIPTAAKTQHFTSIHKIIDKIAMRTSKLQLEQATQGKCELLKLEYFPL
jgi:hypothetical protein